MTDTPQTNVQKLTSMFTGKSAGGSAAAPMELANTTPTGSKRGRIEDQDPANPVFTKLDLLDLLDEQEDNYKKIQKFPLPRHWTLLALNFARWLSPTPKSFWG